MEEELQKFYYKKSRVQQLKGFCYTVQFGSVTKASEYMGLSRTAVTLQIKALEEDLNVKLFERISNRLVITKEGQVFYDLAVVQLQGMSSLFEAFHTKINEMNKNTLVIATCNSGISCVLPKYITKFTKQKEFKDVQITLCNITPEEAFKELITGQVDFAFYPSNGDGKNIPVEIEEEKIFKSKFALFLNKSHPLAKKPKITRRDVEKYEYMMISDKYTLYHPGRSINFRKSRIRFRNGSSHFIIRLMRGGVKVSAVGNAIWKSTYSDLVFRDIDHLLPDIFYSLFSLKNKQHKASVNYFINELRKDKGNV
ncbi:LysR family transcriptional regulator [Pseudomonadota bacterium]